MEESRRRTTSERDGYMDSVINRVVEKGLCVRCGGCIAVCPHDVLAPDEVLFPIPLRPEKCTSCDLCISICPGHDVDFPSISRDLFDDEFDYHRITGHVTHVYAASATDSAMREAGSSGGLITALLSHHLRSGLIDAALVIAMDPDAPLEPLPVLAKTADAVVRASQSKYTIVNPLIQLKGVPSLPGRIAVAGLPCQIHGLRKWMAIDRRLREKIRLIVGLVCNMTLEKEASLALLKRRGIRADDVAKLEYRAGTWPGGIRVTLKNGELVRLHEGNIKDGAFNFLKCLYYPMRCLSCIDFSNEFADLSVADPWIRDGRKFLFPHNTSTVLTRTSRGEEALRRAEDAGAITTREIPPSLLAEQFGAGYASKRKGLAVRRARLLRRGKAFPDYHIQIPAPRFSDRVSEAKEDILRLPGKSAILRKAGTFLAFSWVGKIAVKLKGFTRGAI